jgi:Rieske Fe-S protein
MQRRNFIKLLGSSAFLAVSPSLIDETLKADDGTLYKSYERVKLVDASGKAIKSRDLKEDVTYVFNYPLVGTPCFLVDIGKETSRNVKLKSEGGEEYIWRGGIGAKNSIVSYSGICSHQLTHPTPKNSFISYVPKSEKTLAYKSGGVIVCASHLSAFNPAEGAKRVTGEAKYPLASIVLEIDAEDEIYAVGILGTDKFQEYFKSFKGEFKEFYDSRRKAKKRVIGSAVVVTIDEFSKEVIIY